MRSVLLTGLATGLLAFASAAPAQAFSVSDPKVQSFIDDLSRQHRFDRSELQSLLGSAELRQDIIDAISSPAEKLPWHRYRPIFLKPERVSAGVEFWEQHADLLARLSREYGVPEEIMVAIVGVETYYGRHKGRHRVIDALATLAFSYPPRGDFFRSELEHFLLLSREEAIDPLQPTGSYAGAMGMPQFISSSYRHYAVDGDGDGRRNLFDNPADALASVANYFRRHGWRNGEPVVFPAQAEGEAWRGFVNSDLKPATRYADLKAAGVSVEPGLAPDETVKLVVLEGSGGDEAWVALNNFYVITRYNRSPLYAMAVYQLSQEIRAARSRAG